jgi:hypothetical protein
VPPGPVSLAMTALAALRSNPAMSLGTPQAPFQVVGAEHRSPGRPACASSEIGRPRRSCGCPRSGRRSRPARVAFLDHLPAAGLLAEDARPAPIRGETMPADACQGRHRTVGVESQTKRSVWTPISLLPFLVARQSRPGQFLPVDGIK